MPRPRRRHLVILCDVSEVEDKLEKYNSDYVLIGSSCYQVGMGYGAKVNAMLAFQRIPGASEEPDGKAE